MQTVVGSNPSAASLFFASGKRFALARQRNRYPAWTSSLQPDGSDPRELTTPVASRVERPGSFSLDGAWLAFTRGRDSDLDPGWMPSGQQIAYQAGKAYQNAQTLKVLRANPDGSCNPVVAAGKAPDAFPWNSAPAWRPGDARRGDRRLPCSPSPP
jgi:Tol biopolymer transport system component